MNALPSGLCPKTPPGFVWGVHTTAVPCLLGQSPYLGEAAATGFHTATVSGEGLHGVRTLLDSVTLRVYNVHSWAGGVTLENWACCCSQVPDHAHLSQVRVSQGSLGLSVCDDDLYSGKNLQREWFKEKAPHRTV